MPCRLGPAGIRAAMVRHERAEAHVQYLEYPIKQRPVRCRREQIDDEQMNARP